MPLCTKPHVSEEIIKKYSTPTSEPPKVQEGMETGKGALLGMLSLHVRELLVNSS